ncbi:MAG: AAA family ATPase [Eubacteriaceae bacterium]|jgi:CO dehydrogenase maturation factor|nr:AAA family ATPase [Eubacteriaceae bacterium]
MAYTIAVAGKGGTGKTTICGLIIDYLSKQRKTPILAVDADANSNLNEVLGVKIELTLGDIREEVAQAELAAVNPIPAGVSKMDYMESKFSNALIEENDFDMLVMGRSQGEGCYCYVNGVLKTQITRFAGNYKYIVVDNEAGMEHISRGIVKKVDAMLLVSDASRRGVQAVGRIAQLVSEMKIQPTQMGVIINRAPNGFLSEGVKEEIALQNLNLLGVIPHDELVYQYDSDGIPTVQLPEDAPSKAVLRDILKTLGI